ncbi:MAG: histidine triad nucleotide-binding protein [Alphaproteobacteria bacterium]|jgi:histidine triad (HIT) family protein
MAYDMSNIFARILRDELPCKKVAEDEHTLAFEDINPQAPTHILVIPKGHYVDWTDFAANASPDEQAAFTRMIGHVAEIAAVDGTGYRVISNIGEHGHQEVPHLHMHVLGGAPLGPMLSRASG